MLSHRVETQHIHTMMTRIVSVKSRTVRHLGQVRKEEMRMSAPMVYGYINNNDIQMSECGTMCCEQPIKFIICKQL